MQALHPHTGGVEKRRFDASWEAMAEAQIWLSDRCAALGLPDGPGNSLQVCFEELATNILRHGNVPGGGTAAHGPLWIEVSIGTDNRQAILTVQDNAAGFDLPHELAHSADRASGSAQVGGLGLTLIRKLADRVEHVQSVTGNCTTLHFEIGT